MFFYGFFLFFLFFSITYSGEKFHPNHSFTRCVFSSFLSIFFCFSILLYLFFAFFQSISVHFCLSLFLPFFSHQWIILYIVEFNLLKRSKSITKYIKKQSLFFFAEAHNVSQWMPFHWTNFIQTHKHIILRQIEERIRT